MADAAARTAFQALLANSDRDRAPFGWKVALNFPEAQRRLGLTHALAAPLARDRCHHDASTLHFAPDGKVHVEAELAIALSEDVTSWRPLDVLRRAIGSYAPCLEFVDYALSRRDLASMFAHSFFHAGAILGAVIQASDFVPLPAALPKVERDDGETRTRVDGIVPDDLAIALHALMERVLEAGGSLRRGQWVLCGSYTDPIPLPPGASLRAQFGPQLGMLTVQRDP